LSALEVSVVGLRVLCEVFQIIPGSIESCVAVLRRGDLLCVSPGGVREALFADPDHYNMIWGERLGFAKASCVHS
jgi:hypothetical protein